MPNDEKEIKTHKATSAPASHHHPGAAGIAGPSEAHVPTPEELDERQRRTGTTRKPAGPPHEPHNLGIAGDDDRVPDVPPTDVKD